ncbi:hypothetical protein FACS189483_03220 [Spirochaetia bacterium]|nr:hypothetical protein FACS189483_03220 [Spirochaetia bacterium]
MNKNKFSVLGMLAMVLVLGLVFAGCVTDGGRVSPETAPQPKSLTIMGMPAGYSCYLRIENLNEPWGLVAVGGANLGTSEQNITFSLVLGDDPWRSDPVAWTGTGGYLVKFYIFETKDSSLPKANYYVGGTSDITPVNFNDETPSQTVAFNQFKEQWWD